MTPFSTLVRVETRKMLDTRTSLILTGLMAALAVALVAGRALTTETANLFTLGGTASIALGILLPVLGVLTVTGEWSHRTALTTFTLEPRRERVLMAKCLPVLAAAVASCLLAMLFAAPMTALSAAVHGIEPVWRLEPGVLLGWVATMVLLAAQGLAMGLLLLNAPAAIVICMAGTMVWSFLANLGEAGRTLAAWLDLGTTTNALTGGEPTGGDLARLAVSALVWIVVPMTAGILRIRGADVD
jgi:ABC-2 type transport system permease protein